MSTELKLIDDLCRQHGMDKRMRPSEWLAGHFDAHEHNKQALVEARETNRRLNRRCQELERADERRRLRGLIAEQEYVNRLLWMRYDEYATFVLGERRRLWERG